MATPERPSRASSVTLENEHEKRKSGDLSQNGEKSHDREVSHSEGGIPLPSEIRDENERAEIMARMNQNAVNAMLQNPLAGKSREVLIRDVKSFVRDNGFEEDEEIFIKGALVAQRPDDIENIADLTDEDKAALRFETTHKWRQPFTLYFLVGRAFQSPSDFSFVQYGSRCPRNG
jgi:hypothetical protein